MRADSKRQATKIGDQIEDPAAAFLRETLRVVEWAKDNGVDFQPFRFHDLRHRHAVTWLQSGRSIYDLQQRLGHSTIKMTEAYLEFVTGDQQRINTHGQRVAVG